MPYKDTYLHEMPYKDTHLHEMDYKDLHKTGNEETHF